ncbi:armadillo-type protein [Glomus cerebriforme]|uniref:Exportin-T n=1 Tax=Glomus cerebriforme TaxID=658196 RepID=A0A397TLT0_9GLOM|nr:armadillo-type protein [Glomus cerebriforme]
MEEQIEQAVAFALSPTADQSLKSQAMNFCEQIKVSPDGWQLCLSLFVRFPKSTPEARLFALQVLEDVMQNRFSSLGKSQVVHIQSTLMEFVKREYVIGEDNGDEFSAEPQYLKNKFAHTLTLLFIQMYPSDWYNFFDQFLELLQTNTMNGNKTNIRAIDIFLRILISIDEEVVNIEIPRGKEQAHRNTAIKDNMRAGDVQKLTLLWYELLSEYRVRNQDIAGMCLNIIGLYIAWIDITLIVNDAFITLLYELLDDTRLRIAACECLTEIVCKGMKPVEKLKLIEILNLTNVMRGLDLTDDIEFVEHVAKLTNVLGAELCKIWEADTATKAVAYNQIELLFPFLLDFLANEYDDVSCAVFSFVSALQAIFKKQKKQPGSLTGSQIEFLDSLLKIIVIKMKYDDETDWGGTEEEEVEEAEFLEMRKNLKTFFEAICNIDEQLFTSYVHTAVINTLVKYQRVRNSIDWRELELALHVLLLYGEAFKGQLIFVIKHDNEIVAFTPLGEMVSKMIQCNVSTYPHPAMPLIFFENVVRYYQFFEVQLDCIPAVLEAFVDSRGLHNAILQIRTRSWYLFHRFVKLLRSRMGPYVETVLTNIQDLLVVQANLSSIDVSDGTITKDQAMEGGFNDQIYLFETVGTLITVDTIPTERQTEFAKIVISPLLADIERNLSKEMSEPEDLLHVFQLHHLIIAIGSIGKGFPDAPKVPSAQWVVLLKQSTEAILVAFKALSRFEIIREAARYAFARLVNVLGAEILPYLPELITGLLNESQVSELVDFLPFIGLLSHKFNPSIYDILNELIGPLVTKIFYVLNQTPSGTDEAMLLLNLRKAYLGFILSLLNVGMDAVFISDLNQPRLESILQSVVHYASDPVDLPSAKTAFNILSKTLVLWGSSTSNITSVDSGRSLPGFEQFMYEHILRICFEVPMKPEFSITDGQSSLVLNEISSILKTMYSLRGHELLDYLRRIWLPQDFADEFLQALQQLELKGFRKYFQTFVQKSKS